MHMKIQIYSLVLTFVLLLIPHTGTVNTKLPITLEAANAQLKGNGPTISEHENGKIVENNSRKHYIRFLTRIYRNRNRKGRNL